MRRNSISSSISSEGRIIGIHISTISSSSSSSSRKTISGSEQ
jgi:hypothetical protein